MASGENMRRLRNNRHNAVFEALKKMPKNKKFYSWQIYDELKGKVARRMNSGQIGGFLKMIKGVKNLGVNVWIWRDE